MTDVYFQAHERFINAADKACHHWKRSLAKTSLGATQRLYRKQRRVNTSSEASSISVKFEFNLESSSQPYDSKIHTAGKISHHGHQEAIRMDLNLKWNSNSNLNQY